MSARIEYHQRAIRVFFDGEIDHHAAGLMRVGIDNAIMHKRPQLLVLDFGAVTFMDSSGIGLIMGRSKLMKACGGQLVVHSPQPYIKRVLKLSGIERIVSIT